jgi:hypothetical protein
MASLRPALKHGSETYTAPLNGQHLDALPAHLAAEFYRRAMRGDDLSEIPFRVRRRRLGGTRAMGKRKVRARRRERRTNEQTPNRLRQGSRASVAPHPEALRRRARTSPQAPCLRPYPPRRARCTLGVMAAVPQKAVATAGGGHLRCGPATAVCTAKNSERFHRGIAQLCARSFGAAAANTIAACSTAYCATSLAAT